MAVDSDEQDHMLTTVDNPWNPFTHYDEWYAWDHAQGYDTPSLLARIAKVGMDLSDTDFDLAIDQAIDEIVQQNVSGVHTKATRPIE